MTKKFEIAEGIVSGRDHRLIDKNNQDAKCTYIDDKKIIAIVCDGCSEGKNSEVGAKIASRLLVEEIKKQSTKSLQAVTESQFWEIVRQNVLAQIRCLALSLGGSFTQVIVDYFLFTIVGFVLTENDFILFSIGDGYVQINDENISIGPFPGNEPPYMAYSLLDSSMTKKDPELLKFNMLKVIKTEQVTSVIIGSDGIDDLVAASGKNIPGKDELIGEIVQFISNDKFYTNSFLLGRRLAMINKDSVKYIRDVKGTIIEVKKENGRLKDDTTMVCLRRKKIQSTEDSEGNKEVLEDNLESQAKKVDENSFEDEGKKSESVKSNTNPFLTFFGK